MRNSERSTENRPRSRRITRRTGTFAVAGLSVVGLGTAGAVYASRGPVDGGHQSASSHDSLDPTTTTVPPTTTTTTTNPETSRPSGEFIGAMELVRTNANELNTPQGIAEARVFHGLSNGMWETLNGKDAVNPNPMYNNGFVYNQNTAAFGTPGETAVVSGHDVTQINAPINVNGTVWNQPEVTQSVSAKPDPKNPGGGIGNMEDGDEIVIYINEPNNTETVFTYTVNDVYYINPNENASVQALADPPASSTVSQLIDYNCWEPYTATYRQVYASTLTSTNTISGNISHIGTNSPNYSAGIQ